MELLRKPLDGSCAPGYIFTDVVQAGRGNADLFRGRSSGLSEGGNLPLAIGECCIGFLSVVGYEGNSKGDRTEGDEDDDCDK